MEAWDEEVVMADVTSKENSIEEGGVTRPVFFTRK